MSKIHVEEVLRKIEEDCEKIYKELQEGKYDLTHFERKFFIGRCELNVGNFEEGEEKLLEALSIQKEENELLVKLYSDLALCMYKKNQVSMVKQYLYKTIEFAEIYNDYEYKNKAYINIGVILIDEKLYDGARGIYSKVDLEYLSSLENKYLYVTTICNMAVLSYYLLDVESGNKYKDIFMEYYKNCRNKNENKFLKYLILQAKNECIGDFNKSIRYINKIFALGEYKYYEYSALEDRKQKAFLYKRLGQDERALNLLMKTLEEANSKGYYKMILELVELIVSWGCENRIPRELCINLLLLDIKKNNEEKEMNINREMEQLEERIYLKKSFSKIEKDKNFLNEKLSKLSFKSKIDGLTSLYNRGYLESFLKEEMNYAKRYVTYGMLDLDNFKAVNDGKGHMFGDRVLVEMSTIVKYGIDIKGKVFRYGGDEIFIIFEHNSRREGKNLLNKIKDKIENSNINNNLEKKVTLSIGAVICKSTQYRGMSVSERINLIGECDKLLYESKKNGKNRISLRVMN